MSLNINPVNWFEIPVTDLDRARKFYEQVLDIEITVQEFGELKMGWFPSSDSSPGASGSLVQNDHYTPSYHGSMVYFSVEDIQSILKNVEQLNGKILSGKTSIGEFGYVGHFEDSEGNRIGIHSRE